MVARKNKRNPNAKLLKMKTVITIMLIIRKNNNKERKIEMIRFKRRRKKRSRSVKEVGLYGLSWTKKRGQNRATITRMTLRFISRISHLTSRRVC